MSEMTDYPFFMNAPSAKLYAFMTHKTQTQQMGDSDFSSLFANFRGDALDQVLISFVQQQSYDFDSVAEKLQRYIRALRHVQPEYSTFDELLFTPGVCRARFAFLDAKREELQQQQAFAQFINYSNYYNTIPPVYPLQNMLQGSSTTAVTSQEIPNTPGDMNNNSDNNNNDDYVKDDHQPSGFSILKDSLYKQFSEIYDDVKKYLPTITLEDNSDSENEDEDEFNSAKSTIGSSERSPQEAILYSRKTLFDEAYNDVSDDRISFRKNDNATATTSTTSADENGKTTSASQLSRVNTSPTSTPKVDPAPKPPVIPQEELEKMWEEEFFNSINSSNPATTTAKPASSMTTASNGSSSSKKIDLTSSITGINIDALAQALDSSRGAAPTGETMSPSASNRRAEPYIAPSPRTFEAAVSLQSPSVARSRRVYAEASTTPMIRDFPSQETASPMSSTDSSAGHAVHTNAASNSSPRNAQLDARRSARMKAIEYCSDSDDSDEEEDIHAHSNNDDHAAVNPDLIRYLPGNFVDTFRVDLTRK